MARGSPQLNSTPPLENPGAPTLQAQGDAPPALRASYDAVANARYTPVEPKHLLARATTALRSAKGLGGPNWIQGFKS